MNKLISKPEVGDMIHYLPGCSDAKPENGIIKEARPEVDAAVWVVYHCNSEWHRYKEYTGQKPMLRDLREGWAQL